MHVERGHSIADIFKRKLCAWMHTCWYLWHTQAHIPMPIHTFILTCIHFTVLSAEACMLGAVFATSECVDEIADGNEGAFESWKEKTAAKSEALIGAVSPVGAFALREHVFTPRSSEDDRCVYVCVYVYLIFCAWLCMWGCVCERVCLLRV